jgi:hypothetical protein
VEAALRAEALAVTAEAAWDAYDAADKRLRALLVQRPLADTVELIRGGGAAGRALIDAVCDVELRACQFRLAAQIEAGVRVER